MTLSFLRFPSRSALGRGADSLDLELDVDAVADQDAARLEELIPGEAEVLSIQRRLCCEANPFVPPWVLAAAAVRGVQRDLPRDTVEGQIADDAVAVFPDLLDALAREAELGKLFDVQEVRG